MGGIIPLLLRHHSMAQIGITFPSYKKVKQSHDRPGQAQRVPGE